MNWNPNNGVSSLGTVDPDLTNGGGRLGARLARLALADGKVAVVLSDEDVNSRLPARSIVPITADDEGRTALVVFANDDPWQPVVVGLLLDQPVPSHNELSVNGRRITLDADDELTLRSGKASITLSASGRIVIKGMEIVSRARGTHKVKGATVLIN